MACTLGERISESATTSVYTAFDDALHRRVLLKALHPHLAHDDLLRQRFIREARACAALRSEYIAQIFELSELNGSPAIVMEYVDGRSLKEVIADGDLRTFSFTQKVAVHVLRGLAVAHAHGIVHRDIKPGNILVPESGSVKITDFGLAQVALSPTITTEGTVVGTPAYLAPEVIRGEQADIRTDLFSLGATLVETLTGERMFEGASYSECLHRVAAFTPKMLDRFAAASSPEFVAFLQRLMHPDPSHRFATPQDALAAFGKTGSSEFIVPEDLRPGRGFRAMLTYAAVGASLLIIAGFLVFIRQYRSHQESPALPALAVSFHQADSAGIRAPESGDKTTRSSIRPAKGFGMQGERTAAPSIPLFAPADSGDLLLTSTPWAKVTVDDRPVGESPLANPLRLAVGAHTVVFTNPSFEPIVKSVDVKAGGRIAVVGDFMERAGFLQCRVSPWAEVFVDEQHRDTTPLTRPIVLSAGAHRIRFHHSAFRDIVRDVTIPVKDTLTLNITFSP